MITLITGLPGIGKTALTVEMLLEENKRGIRPLFVMGITDLFLEHIPAPPVLEWTELRPDKDDPKLLLAYFTFPPNSILIIDEAQRIYRPRASSSKVPEYVAALETHRHTGLDIWLITQKPHLLDSNVRELIGRHIHLRQTILGRKLYEWPEYQDVNNKNNLSMAVKRGFSPPKSSFAYYKSAEIHTKQKARFHQIYLLLLLSLSFILYLGYGLYSRHFIKIDKSINPISSVQANKANDNFTNDLKNVSSDLIEKPQVIKHPYSDFVFTLKGSLQSKTKTIYFYELTKSGKSIFLKDSDLTKLGYHITQNTDCSSFLYFNGAEVTASCGSITEQNKQNNISNLKLLDPAINLEPALGIQDNNDYQASPST